MSSKRCNLSPTHCRTHPSLKQKGKWLRADHRDSSHGKSRPDTADGVFWPWLQPDTAPLRRGVNIQNNKYFVLTLS